MSFEWHKFLEFADTVCKKATDFPDAEAVYRTATSRAYYAAYCEARNFVAKKDRQTFHSNAHQQLQDYLITHQHPDRQKLGRHLKALHQFRLKADYEGELSELPVNLANQAIAWAKKIIEVDLPPLTGKKI